MAPTIGEPVAVPRLTRRRPRDHDAEQAVRAVIELHTAEEAIPVTGFADMNVEEREDAARKFGNRVQGYADRDHKIKVRASYDRETETLYLTLRDPEGEVDDTGEIALPNPLG